MTVLIDSWAWIEYFKGSSFGAKAREYIESGQEILISAINVSEVYKYLLRNKPDKAEEFMRFILKISFVVSIDISIALKAAVLKHEKKFGLADAIVLATARMHNCPVVTGDDDFEKEKDVIYIEE